MTRASDELDLSGRELKNRTFTHLHLAFVKQMRVKSRKAKGFACEMLLPPLILCALLIGWGLADNDVNPPEDYAKNDYYNVTDLVHTSTCVRFNDSKYSGNANLGARHTLTECAPDNNCSALQGVGPAQFDVFPITLGDGHAQLCPIAGNQDETVASLMAFSNLINATSNAESLKHGQTVPSFDAMVVLQKFARAVFGDLDFQIDGYQNSLQHSGWLEIASSVDGCDTAMQMVDHFNATTALYNIIFNTSIDRGNPECGNKVFKTEKEAVDFIKSDDGANYVWGLLLVNEVDKDAQTLDYTIRLNYTSAPYTIGNADKFAEGLGKGRGQQYINAGFPTLQATANAYVVAPTEGKYQKYDFDFVTIPMPMHEYKSSQFFDQAGNLIPLCMALSFLYPVSCLVSGVVLEKEQRLREGMLIMGLSKSAFYSSWFLTYFAMMTFSSLLMTLVTGTTYFQHTSAMLLFLLFELYSLSMVAFGLLMSVFFSKAKIAAIAAPLLSFVLVVPKFSLSDDIPVNEKVGVSFLSPCAFGYGMDLVTNYEKQGQGSGFNDFFADDYAYATSIFMMVLDLAIYLLLAIYLDLVLPSEYGVKLHPLFFLMPSYWTGRCKKAERGEFLNDHESTHKNKAAPKRRAEYVETGFDAATQHALHERERVRIMGIRKEFKNGDRLLLAVDNFGNGLPKTAPGGGAGFPMYEGQIQCILGHNGAGKTTLINMLTGMLPASDGDCMIWGQSIRDDVQDIRKNIGYCPQHNILWDRLTVEEHLRFYGSLKGVTGDDLDSRIVSMLQLVNLYEKRGAWSSVLSGGQKRKLSVACALIGGSRLVFLDEPTAGMDVESRRAMWDLLRNPKVLEGRVIVLTTHYMEEADLLGDSVAIMHKGCLHSWGSPFFLKSKLGVGYNMSISMRPKCRPSDVERVIASNLPRAAVSRVSCTGNELRVLVPISCEPTDAIKKLVADKLALEYSTPAKLHEDLSALIKEGPVEKQDAAMTALEDIRTANAFPDLFDQLDANKTALKVESYGISVTTLEEVFLKIEMEGQYDTNEYALDGSTPAPSPKAAEAAAGHTLSPMSGGSATPMLSPDASSMVSPAASTNVGFEHDFSQLYTIKEQPNDEWVAPESGMTLFKTQFYGLFMKRFRYGRRDKRALCFQFALPVALIIFALWIGTLNPPAMPELVMDAANKRVFGGDKDKPVEVGYAATPAADDFFKADPFGAGYLVTNVTDACKAATTAAGLSACLLEDYDAHGRTYRRGAAVYTPLDGRPPARPTPAAVGNDNTVVYVNASSVHGVPAMVSAMYNAYMNDALGQRQGGAARIVARSHPLPFSDRLKALIDALKVVITGLFIMIPFTLIPSNFVSYIVKERECKSKHVQVISGANLGAYWASSFLFDFLAYCVTVLLAFIVFFADSRDEFVGDASCFFATLLLFLLFGCAAITISYAMSFMFQTYTAAQNAAMIFHFFCGFIFVIVVKVLAFIDSTKDVADVLRWVFRLIPSYCLGEGIINLSSRTAIKEFGDVPSPWDMETAGAPIIFLLLSTIAYTCLTILIEARGMKGSTITFAEIKEMFLGKKSDALDAKTVGGYGTLDAAHDAHTPYDDDDDERAPNDPEMVLKRKGAWLTCKDAASGRLFYFNESTGESKWSSKDTPFYEDLSVMQHAREILATSKGRPNDAVVVRRLRKVWAKRGNMAKDKVAVRDLSFAVESGELFAFLGTNGAGKTTTLSVLSGEFPPSHGRAWIAGHDVVAEGAAAKQNLGFCPQFDACLELLTCEEHMELFASLRGIPKDRIQPSIELLLTGLGLEPHRKKMSKNLSGGNRRKLSVAIALLGGPPVVFLDEPSAGMDPIARRGLWLALENAITNLNLSVVLTTHHLEEIEGLARLNHRVTIMVDGKLQCLGSLSQLKNNFGDSYELIVKVHTQADEAKLSEFMKQHFPKAVLVESSQQRVTYNVAKEDTKLSGMFREIETNRRALGIDDYSINETSLEQVFIRISQRALREEEAETYKSEANADVAKFAIRAPPADGNATASMEQGGEF